MANNRAVRISKDDLRASVGENIRAARNRAEPKLTQEDVANFFNPPLTRAAVAQWEVGETLPDLDRLAVLSKRFGVTIDSLTFGDDPAVDKDGLTPDAIKMARFYLRLDAKQRAIFAAFLRDSAERSMMQSIKRR